MFSNVPRYINLEFQLEKFPIGILHKNSTKDSAPAVRAAWNLPRRRRELVIE